MTAKPSPTPWMFESQRGPYTPDTVYILRDSSGNRIAFIMGTRSLQAEEYDDANAAHIVACVNAHQQLVNALEQANLVIEKPTWLRKRIEAALEAAKEGEAQ